MRLQPLRPLTAQEALGSGNDVLALQAHALRAVLALVPASAAAFLTIGRRFDLERTVFMQNEPRGLMLGELWYRHLAETWGRDPLLTREAAAAETVVATGDADLDESRAAELQEARIGDRIAVYLRVSGATGAAVVLIRSLNQPLFDRRELITLRRTQPLIEQAYAAAVGERSGPIDDALRASGLTAREAEIARLVGRGATNAEIGRALHVTEATVKTHLRRIYAKLGIRSRIQLTILVGTPAGHG